MNTETTKQNGLKLEIVSITDIFDERLSRLDIDEDTKMLLENLLCDIFIKIHEEIIPLIEGICEGEGL